MHKSNCFDLVIIGGGIIGAATLYQYQKKYPDQKVLLLEKSPEFASHQTGRNSGVIHSGIYYQPGSLKAKNCREGLKLLYDFCKEFEVPHDNCGKLIIAKNDKEVPRLKALKQRGEQNGLLDISYLDEKEAQEFEPFVSCINALHVKDTGIVDYGMVTQKLIEQALTINNESKVKCNHWVSQFKKNGSSTRITTNSNEFEAEKVVFCTGLHSDRFAKMDGLELNIKVVPFRGDYYVLKKSAFHKVKNLIYPLADPNLPFLGVHLTRMMNGTIECGPNAVFSFEREGYEKLSFSLEDSIDALSFQGTWKLFGRYWKQGLSEYIRAFSKDRFLKSLQEMVPRLQKEDLGDHRAGVRAQVVDENGNLIDDFLIKSGDSAIHVINAPSPAATSCLSIGNQIVSSIEAK